MAIPALALFALSATGDVAAWMVMALVLARGTCSPSTSRLARAS